MILYKASRIEIVPAQDAVFLFFIFARTFLYGLFLLQKTGHKMQLTLFTNNNDMQIVSYKLARIVFAETNAISLPIVEAMASMIYNIHTKYDKSFESIAKDTDIFDCLNPESNRHEYLNVDANDKKFQMCLRVIQTMLHGNLKDTVFGATKFHRADVIPDWAMSRGYISECEDILFYL